MKPKDGVSTGPGAVKNGGQRYLSMARWHVVLGGCERTPCRDGRARRGRL